MHKKISFHFFINTYLEKFNEKDKIAFMIFILQYNRYHKKKSINKSYCIATIHLRVEFSVACS